MEFQHNSYIDYKDFKLPSIKIPIDKYSEPKKKPIDPKYVFENYKKKSK